MAEQKPGWAHLLKQVGSFLPPGNPTFDNPGFRDATCRILIVRLSPFRDVDRSIPHLFLFQEVRRALPRAFIDLAFFPSAVERELFDREAIPYLVGVQSRRPASEFDLVLISNAYTLELVNLPYLLVRSGIPLFSSQRGPEWPFLILGGSNAMAAQAIVGEDGDSLVDGVFFGEGEGAVGELVRRVGESAGRRTGGSTNQRLSKGELLARVAERAEGLWVAGSLRTTHKAVCRPEARFLPVEYPILNTPEAHTANLQITYGCPSFCSFCFEGYDRKPYRELPLPDVLAVARRVKRAQGVEELNLYSFNFNTYQDILEMILELHHLFERVSLKSQRVDILNRVPGLLEAEVEADKRNFTLGIEGISDRLRAWLHKSLPAEDITDLLERVLALKIRRVKLFYVLTGYETDDDVKEFRRFLRWLKETRRRSRNRSVRVIFSFGLLVRMPFTPLRYDRLLLDEQEWRPLIGKVKSACETNGFEFRLAFDWPAYCVTQVLAMGGHWLVEPLVALARGGYYFDTTLEPAYWDELRRWLVEAGHWDDAFLDEKAPDYRFALEFVRSNVSDEFLYRQYQEAQAGDDSGYCLGDHEQPGRCLGCGACVDEGQRQAITHHQIRWPERIPYITLLRETVARKRRLEPTYFRARLDAWLAGVVPEFLNGFVFRSILVGCPDLVDNLLSVRESLFTVRSNDRRFPSVSGETVFALKAWDAKALGQALETRFFEKNPVPGVEVLGLAPGFTPGEFAVLHLEMHLPAGPFPEPRVRLEQYLRGAYVRYSLRREDGGFRFDLPQKALKKRILFGGSFETREGDQGFSASLDVGPKFDLGAFLRMFDGQGPAQRAQVRVSDVAW
jgi:radical SAM superfamily enzyme YgiQ (UPF0313 family)/ferredoxin